MRPTGRPLSQGDGPRGSIAANIPHGIAAIGQLFGAGRRRGRVLRPATVRHETTTFGM